MIGKVTGQISIQSNIHYGYAANVRYGFACSAGNGRRILWNRKCMKWNSDVNNLGKTSCKNEKCCNSLLSEQQQLILTARKTKFII